eukprot:3339301-Pyramimonas_sp.AAC.1
MLAEDTIGCNRFPPSRARHPGCTQTQTTPRGSQRGCHLRCCGAPLGKSDAHRSLRSFVRNTSFHSCRTWAA